MSNLKKTECQTYGMAPDKDFIYSLAHIDIEINHRCNLACKHCSAEAGNGSVSNELQVTEICTILRNAQELGLKKVGLTGGEPLIDIPKLQTIVEFCLNELNVPLHTHTNGTLITEDLCGDHGVLRSFESVSITFLAGNAEIHDSMTGIPGSFERAFQATALLTLNKLPLTCYFIPTHGTCAGFADLALQLHDIGVKRIRPMALAPSGRARAIYGETAPLVDELKRFQESLIEVQDTCGMTIEAGCCTRLSMPDLDMLKGHETCMSGINRVHINSSGDVFPCTAASGVKELTLGNLRDNHFDIADIWHNSDLIKQIRNVRRGRLSACKDCTQIPKCQDACMVNACGTISGQTRTACPLTNHSIEVVQGSA